MRILPRSRGYRLPLMTAGFALLGLGLLFLLRAIFGDAFYAAYTPFCRALLRVISHITGILPFSLAEGIILCAVTALPILLLVLIFRAVFSLGERPRQKLCRFLLILLAAACVLAFLFYLFWGMSYGAPPLAEQLGLEVRKWSEEELFRTAELMLADLNLAADQVSRNDDGTLRLESFPATAAHAVSAVSAYTGHSVARPKPVGMSTAMSYAGITGIFIPHTAEANVNTRNRTASLCFTAAHELMHREAVAPEDETNFAAFHALYEKGDAEARYSALFTGWMYIGNKLSSADYRTLYAQLHPGVRADLRAYSELWDAYAGTVVEEVASSANNAYLTLQGEPDGIRSYGRMVDLLIAFYLSRI